MQKENPGQIKVISLTKDSREREWLEKKMAIENSPVRVKGRQKILREQKEQLKESLMDFSSLTDVLQENFSFAKKPSNTS